MGNYLAKFHSAKTGSGAQAQFIFPPFATHVYVTFFIPRLPISPLNHIVQFFVGAAGIGSPQMNIHSIGLHKAFLEVPASADELRFTTSGVSSTGNYIMKADFVVKE